MTALQQLILAAIGSGLAGSLLTAFMNRRKVSADATRIIADAAASVVQTMRADNTALRQEQIEDRKRIERLEQQHAADRKAQQLHVSWDMIARERLHAAGIDLPEPPPLYAPDVPA